MPKQQKKRFRALLEVGKELASITELDVLLDRILDISRIVFHLDNAIIRLLSEDDLSLETVAAFGYDDHARNTPIAVGEGIMGRVAQTRELCLINNLTSSEDYIPGIYEARSELAIPLIAGDELIGVFNVESRQTNAFNEEDCDFLSILAGQAAIAIDKARLYDDLSNALREKQKLYNLNQQILASISLGLYAIDKNLRITSWNDSMVQISSIEAEQAIGKNLLDLFPSLEQEGIADRIRQVLQTGKAIDMRLLHRGLSGRKRLQKRKIAPLKDRNRTIGAVVVVEDITEFEQLLAQTIQSEKLAEVGRMSAAIAHEINNPLAAISIANDILTDNFDNVELQQELLGRIDSEVERLKSLTSEMLSYSSAEQRDERRSTDLNDIITEINELLGHELNKKRISLDFRPGVLPPLMINRNKFKQIFINLTLNSVQAMEKHGQISITTEIDLQGVVSIHFCDDGPGIPEDLIEQIFEPFFTDRKDGTGTGLGLYLCRKIVNSYNGELSVRNRSDGGCCFTISLPKGIGCP